jgi:hypothetical protein
MYVDVEFEWERKVMSRFRIQLLPSRSAGKESSEAPEKPDSTAK